MEVQLSIIIKFCGITETECVAPIYKRLTALLFLPQD